MEALSNLGINPWILVGQIVNFGILFFIFKRFLYKPILGMLEKREKKIKDGNDKAEKIEQEFAEAEKIKDKKIADAASEAQEIINQAKDNAEQARKEILDKSTEDAENILTKTREEIKIEKKSILEEVRQETASLATAVSEQILKRNLDASMQRQLVDDAIKEIDTYYQSKTE